MKRTNSSPIIKLDLSTIMSHLLDRVRSLKNEPRHIDLYRLIAVEERLLLTSHINHTWTVADANFVVALYQIDDMLDRARANRDVANTAKNLQKRMTDLTETTGITGDNQELLAAIYSYWLFQKQKIVNNRNKKFPYGAMLEAIPAEPNMLVCPLGENLDLLKQKTKRRRMGYVLSGDLDDIELIRELLNNPLDGFGLKEQEKKQIKAVGVIYKAVEMYRLDDCSLYSIVMQCNNQLPHVKSNRNLMQGIDNMLANMKLHQTETSAPELLRLVEFLPQFTAKLKEIPNQKTISQQNEIKIKYLLGSPWPWEMVLQTLEVLPRGTLFYGIKQYLQSISRLIAEGLRDIQWLNAIAENFIGLIKETCSLGIDAALHPDVAFLSGSLPLPSNDAQALSDILLSLNNSEYQNNMSDQLRCMLTDIVRGTAYHLVKKKLLSGDKMQKIPDSLVRQFDDLFTLNNLKKECNNNPLAEPPSLQRIMMDKSPESLWNRMDEAIRSSLRHTLENQFNNAFRTINPEELDRRFSWMLQNEYSEIIATPSVRILIGLSRKVIELSHASDAAIKQQVLLEILRQMEASGQQYLPDIWINSCLAETVLHCLENGTIVDLKTNLPLLAVCHKVHSGEARHRMNRQYINLVTTSGGAEEQIRAIERWRDAISGAANLSELNAIIALRSAKNPARHLKNLDHSTRRRLRDIEMAGQPIKYYLNESLKECASVDEFMVMVDVADAIGSPFGIGEIPASLLQDKSHLESVWNAVARCAQIEALSHLDTTLPSLRELHQLCLTIDEQKFISWYIKQEKCNEARISVLEELLVALKRLEDAGLSHEEKLLLFPGSTTQLSTGDFKILPLEACRKAILSLANNYSLKIGRLAGLISVLQRESYRTLNSYLQNQKDWENLAQECIENIHKIQCDEFSEKLRLYSNQRAIYLKSGTLTSVVSEKSIQMAARKLERDNNLTIFLCEKVSLISKSFQKIEFDFFQIRASCPNKIDEFYQHLRTLKSDLQNLDIDENVKDKLLQQLNALEFNKNARCQPVFK